MNVLIVGSGAREHVIVWAVSRSPLLERLFCAPGNAGTAALAENLPLDPMDVAALVDVAVARHIDLVVVGPEAPLAAGLVDALEARGIRAFGPTRDAAELEWSKRYAKQVLAQAGIPHAGGRAFDDPAAAHQYVETLLAVPGRRPPVVKADGLAAGKGVLVPDSADEAHRAVDDLLGGRFGAASATIVIEEHLPGMEASAMAFIDGDCVAPLPLSCDYKRAHDGDTGPNTGGMGVYSPPGFITSEAADSLFSSVHRPVVHALRDRGRPFRGLLYAGLMVSDGDAAVLEFNCRFGDPEPQAVLPRLRSDLLAILIACCEGRLAEQPIAWSDDATVAVVLASSGYPGAFETGKPIAGLDTLDDDVLLFHAATQRRDDGCVVTAGGRILTMVGRGPTLREARDRVYANVDRITFDGCFYRRDIALREC